MIRIRRDRDIHDVQGDWFRARWHFSFDTYSDPDNDSFGAMRVFNDDRLIPGAIWPLHPHRDIEGLTYVVEGLFRHEDNVGGAPGPLPAGSVQRMTLGSGAWHSEQNASETDPLRFIQIWILPDTADLDPEVEQRVFTRDDRTNRLLQVIAPLGDAGSIASASANTRGPVSVHQDAAVYLASLEPGTEVSHQIGADRGAYVYLIEGEASFDDEDVSTGDAGKVTDQPTLRIRAREGAQAGQRAELILVDVPMRFEPVGIWRGRI